MNSCFNNYLGPCKSSRWEEPWSIAMCLSGILAPSRCAINICWIFLLLKPYADSMLTGVRWCRIINRFPQLLADIKVPWPLGSDRPLWTMWLKLHPLSPVTSVINISDDWNYVDSNSKRKVVTFCRDRFEIYLIWISRSHTFYETRLMYQVYLKFTKYIQLIQFPYS